MLFALGRSAYCADPLHWSGKKTRWDRRNNIVELFGDARVTKKGQLLEADYIYLDLNKRHLDAKGKCVYHSEGVVIESEEIHMGIDSQLGSIINGRVSDGSFLLQGELIKKTGAKTYHVRDGVYTTCVDCAPSWSFEGGEVELEVEGYAYMKNVKGRIKDAPFIWFPFLIIPIKKKRQSGLLPARFGLSAVSGTWYLQRFFWVLSDWADMTIGGGWSSTRGRRLELEGRYRISPVSGGVIRGFSLNDLQGDPTMNRWALQISQQQMLPLGLKQKISINEVSDIDYPVDFSGDVRGRSEPATVSQIQITHTGKQFSGFIEVKRYRNLLRADNPIDFDIRTVQVLPRVSLSSSDRFLFSSPVAGGLGAELVRFGRAGGAFDYDSTSTEGATIIPGVDPVRKATRVSVTPRLYSTLRPFDLFTLTPKAEYRSYFYSFDQELPDLSRGYLLLQIDLSMQFERVWDTGDKAHPRMKHLIRPVFRYSRIPIVNEPSHPFLTQIDYKAGYAFDQFDEVPLTSTKNLVNYYTPLGNTFSYGFVSQWVQKAATSEGQFSQYSTVSELTAGQSIDFSELSKPEDEQIPFTRFYSTARTSFGSFGFSTSYFYYPHLSKLLTPGEPNVRSPHEVTVSTSYYFSNKPESYQNLFKRYLTFTYGFRKLRSATEGMSVELAYSLTDYFLPVIGAQYDFLTKRFIRSYFDLGFRSPSHCWHINFRADHTVDKGIALNFNFSLDFTGQKSNVL